MIFTIIKGSKIKRQVSCHFARINSLLGEGESWIEGNYPRTEYRLVNGEPVPLKNKKTLPSDIPRVSIKNAHRRYGAEQMKLIASLPVDLDMTAKEAKDQVDIAAGEARERHSSKGAMIDQEYARIAQQCDDYKRDKKQIGKMLKARAKHTGQTLDQVVDEVIAAKQRFEDVLDQTFEIRTAAFAAINQSESGFYEIAKPYIQQLESL